MGVAAPSNWRLLNGEGGAAEKQSNPMALAAPTQTRSGPWWRSSRRGGAAGRCAPRDRGRDGAAEQALVARAQRGGPREREALVNAYQPMIASVARAYRRSTSVGREELTQEGVVGLLRALERYEPDRGVPFWAYASWWVRQAMQQVVSELSRPMVLSDRALRQLARIKQAQRRFEQARRREATTAELSGIVGLPQAQVEKLLCTERTARGLDEPTGAEAGEGTTVGELLADPPAREAYERVPQQVLAAQVPGLLGQLSDRERTVICSRYGLGQREQTLREIAPRLGVSAERVRQIEQESLTKLYAAVACAPRATA
jgi:RNA polymerase sigma factor (sigma-70 family)